VETRPLEVCPSISPPSLRSSLPAFRTRRREIDRFPLLPPASPTGPKPMTLANAAYLGIERFANDRNKENWTTSSENDKTALIRAVYKQVLGNQYVMSSERLEGPESLFKRGYLSVREFVRQVAKSGLYRSKFFENCNPYRFIELNFKHLLGRAPQNKAEMLHHFTILQEQGFDAEIDSYIDSAEYQNRFGEEVVPYLHGWDYSVGQQGLQFSYMLQLARGISASVKGDILKNQSRLNPSVHAETPLPVVSPNAKGSVFRKVVSDGVTRQGVGGSEEGRTFRVEITGFNNYRLHKRSNRVRFIPFNKLLQYQQQIHREGGQIASITPVN
jgi:phycoerythrin-associated linker protein